MLGQLKQLNFGKLAAESEIDSGLKEYFVETGAYLSIKSSKKFIILGNRGAGKSAIIKMLAEDYKSHNNLVVELVPDDYSYELLQRSMVKEAEGSWAKLGAYTAAWKYLIYILAMKSYYNDNKTILKSTSRKIYNYLRDNHKIENKDYWDSFISYINRIEGIKIGSYEAGIQKAKLQDLYKLEEISGLLLDLSELNKRKPILFLIDELDKGWDASEDAKGFVGGLFHAAISINQLNPNFRVIVSLRKELYDNIPALYEDFQKYSDIFEIIEWDEKSLLRLITKRIKHSLPELGRIPAIDYWKSVFKEQIYNQDSYRYIINRTLFRPREVIQFCIESRNNAVQIRSNKIDANSIVSSEIKYSDMRTKDIATEYKTQYPDILSVFEAFRGVNAVLERAELEDICTRIILGDLKTKNPEWLKNQSEEFLINVLYQTGFLKIHTVCIIKREQQEGYFGCHQIGLSNIGNIKKFTIHEMFRMYLGITEQT